MPSFFETNLVDGGDKDVSFKFLDDSWFSQGSSLLGTKLATMPKSARRSTSSPKAESHDDQVYKII
jgi:hypothetical protein